MAKWVCFNGPGSVNRPFGQNGSVLGLFFFKKSVFSPSGITALIYSITQNIIKDDFMVTNIAVTEQLFNNCLWLLLVFIGK